MIQSLADIAMRSNERGDVTEQDADVAARVVYAPFHWRESWDTLLSRKNAEDAAVLDAYRAEAVFALLDNVILR